MPSARRPKQDDGGRENSSLLKHLQEMQDEYCKQIAIKKKELLSSGPEIVIKGTDIIHRTITDNLPSELLDMSYGDFLNQMKGSNNTFGRANDTLVAIEDLRNRVKSGTATTDEVIKYRELKKLL
uniref:Uncharacterized protein n=1 Tax=Strongyloides venezuelensis TaxID=75913 RepID=A0A0K0G343_STRVS